ncbi:ABC transporter permease [Ruania alba]|uniref:Peptide/nickel transport system permease protein n=1 Tax=Ruania alba TaxID=648782 RepID=A0A1H5NFH0_9MICO|nr:ABC transporter permease [Ruania alba]SEF00353.1 peptide/nickel transport system permease protein [Ruania alba]
MREPTSDGQTTTTEAPASGAGPRTERPTTAWRLLLRNRIAVVGLGFVVLWTIGALLVPLSPYGASQTNAGPLLSPPGADHLFGTDNFGRDILTRVLAGGQVSLWTGLLAVGISFVIGVPLGGLSGFIGGRFGNIVMRVMDVLLAFPPLVLAMAIAASLGAGMSSAMVAVGIVGIPEFARIMYSQTVSLRERDFVEAGHAIGLPRMTIFSRHVVPNALAPILVRATLGMGYAILTAASLSFIGLGAQPPLAEWGVMISDGRGYIISGEWWMTAFPGLAIATSILGFNLLGDGLRDVLDPRLRTSR